MSSEVRPRALFDRVRAPAIAALALCGIAVFVSVVQPLYPIEKWLFWRYANYWALCLLWSAACASTGHAIVRRLAPNLPVLESLFLGFVTGVLAFVHAMFIGGVLKLFGAAFFFLLPVAMVLAGGRSALMLGRRLARRARVLLLPRTVPAAMALVLGLFALALVYVAVIVPDNTTADAHWYHLAAPERYAAQGKIARYPEGWYMGALPQLASLVYTWAFILPQSDLFDRVELAAHLEFFILLATLAGIPILARWMIAPVRRRLGKLPSVGVSWTALFLFPSIFLYDSSLGMGADHVSAFWAIPIFLTLRRVWKKPTVGYACLFAFSVAGALLSKYQSMMLAALPVGAFVARMAWLAARPNAVLQERLAAAKTTAACALAGLGVSAIHWLKNWVWYGDPVFPFGNRVFTPHPWSPAAAHMFKHWFLPTQTWAPTGTPKEKLLETAQAMLTFSFKPHDYDTFHGQLPVFGSLFTLSLPLLIFLPRVRRVWAVAACAQTGVALWYAISHWDRYLQALVPWMAAVVAAVLIVCAALGPVARAGVAALVAFQFIWGGDVPFFPGHALMGQAPAKRAVDLLSSGRRGDFDMRKRVFGYTDLANTLPKDATVLLHEMNGALSIERATVSDVTPWVSGLDYGHMRSPKVLYDTWKSYGVTHILWHAGMTPGWTSMAGEFAFYAYLARYTEPPISVSGALVATLGNVPPPDVEWLKWSATVLVCSEPFAPGVYELGDLAVPAADPRQFPAPRQPLQADADVPGFVQRSHFVAVEGACSHGLDMTRYRTFSKMIVRNGAELWVRRD